jgi:hypothetical protein
VRLVGGYLIELYQHVLVVDGTHLVQPSFHVGVVPEPEDVKVRYVLPNNGGDCLIDLSSRKSTNKEMATTNIQAP